jgi:hypothetical protein
LDEEHSWRAASFYEICPYISPFGPSIGCSTRFVRTNHNSFSWPAQQVSYKDVASQFFPEEFVVTLFLAAD